MMIVYAIIIFCLLVFVHEAGHFVAAKKSGIRVNEFALGMGPKLISFTKGETRYSLRAIPIGGFCAMEGEDEDSEDPRAFNNKPAWKRMIVLFAGSFMNIILAIILISLVIFSVGIPLSTVDEVGDATPAKAAGMKSGDKILQIGDTDVSEWDDISAYMAKLNESLSIEPNESEGVKSEPGKESDTDKDKDKGTNVIPVTVERTGTKLDLNLKLVPDGEGVYRMGITARFEHPPSFFFKSFAYGARGIFEMTGEMYKAIGRLVTGRADLDQLAGPVGIVQAVGESARSGFVYLVQLTALISLNLGIVNLLPFPALDGGRLIFLLIRKVTGKRVTDAVEGKIHLVGMAILFAFMIFITMHDIGKLV